MSDARPFAARMIGRSADEAHRAATPLELFFDLVFVVAIAQAAGALHHAIAENHAAEGLLNYGMVFFAIWWAWMGFTWFATAFDTDDVPYRLATLVVISGALILAAGVPRGSDALDFTIVTLGYVVMRVPLIALWLRAALANPDNRRIGRRSAVGIGVMQTLWVGLLFTPDAWRLPGFFVLVLLELVVPAWAYAGSDVRWHCHHIAERYGLLTIIVLGESILAVSTAAGATLQAGEFSMAVAPTFVGGLLIVYSLWWIYFDRPAHHMLTTRRRAFVWGYGHYLIYAAGAAVGAGIAVSVDQVTHHAEIGAVGAGMSVAGPVAVFVMALWFLHTRSDDPISARALGPVAAAIVLATPFVGEAVLLTGLTLSGLVAAKITYAHRLHVRATQPSSSRS